MLLIIYQPTTRGAVWKDQRGGGVIFVAGKHYVAGKKYFSACLVLLCRLQIGGVEKLSQRFIVVTLISVGL